MRGSNFISFLTLQGLMIGIVFGILASTGAKSFLGFVFFITGFFYLFAHVCIGFYYQTPGAKGRAFSKSAHENDLDFFIREINKQEQKRSEEKLRRAE